MAGGWWPVSTITAVVSTLSWAQAIPFSSTGLYDLGLVVEQRCLDTTRATLTEPHDLAKQPAQNGLFSNNCFPPAAVSVASGGLSSA